MTMQTTAERKPTRRRFVPQFSLRMLLGTITLFSVAAAVWWRWPIVQSSSGEMELLSLGEDPKEGYDIVKVQTVERKRFRHGLWGELIRHGTTEIISADTTQCLLLEEWQDGARHGRFARYYPSGEPREVGAYRVGKRSGDWTYFAPKWSVQGGSPASVVSHWDDGLATGKWEWQFADGKPLKTAEFRGGIIVAINGQPVTDHLAAQFGQEKNKDSVIADMASATNSSAFDRPSRQFTFQPSPVGPVSLENHCAGLAELWQIPVSFDPFSRVDLAVEEVEICGLAPPSAALVLALHEHGLAAVSRYGCLLITTEQIAKGPDPTGLEGLNIPVDGRIAEALNKNNAVLSWSTSLEEALSRCQKETGVEFDILSRQGSFGLAEQLRYPREPRKAFPYNLTLRDALGLALFQTRYRCTLRGDVVVVTPLPLDSWRTGL